MRQELELERREWREERAKIDKVELGGGRVALTDHVPRQGDGGAELQTQLLQRVKANVFERWYVADRVRVDVQAQVPQDEGGKDGIESWCLYGAAGGQGLCTPQMRWTGGGKEGGDATGRTKQLAVSLCVRAVGWW